MAIGHYDLKRTKNKQYYFNLKTSNGEVILTSEMYTTKAAANKGIRSIQANSPEEKNFEIRENKSGKSYFVLKARNYQVIGLSELYDDEIAAKKGIQSAIKNGSSVNVRDLTKSE
ncbi:YegP family protein [Photorhabdus asymbiotica]|uniref:YegP family protein n=1 Tax=Photorhabdus asymbiotica TaxID=291112 RepID=UPI003DA72762